MPPSPGAGNCSGLPGSLFQNLGGSPQINYANGATSNTGYSLIANIGPGSTAGAGGGFERLTCDNASDCGDVTTADDRGAISGALILDNNLAYTFAHPSRATFSTGTGASPTDNAITVGGTAYPSAAIPADSGAFQVVVVNASSLQLVSNDTFTFTQLYSDAPSVRTMYQVLTSAATDENLLVFISSVGTNMGHANWPLEWSRVAQAVAGLGGTYSVFLDIQPTDDYALVGRGSPFLNTGFFPYRGTEASTVVSNATKPVGAPTLAANLRGVLAPDNRGFYSTVLSNRTSTFDQSTLALVDAIALQPPTPWPAMTAGQQLAYSYISQQLLCDQAPPPPPPSCTDIRAAYTNENEVPSSWYSTLEGNNLPYPSGQSFTVDDFDSVKAQLRTEVGYVVVIRQFFQNISALYTDIQTGQDAILAAAYQAVASSLQPGGGTKITPMWQSAITGAETISDDIGSLACGTPAKLALDLFFVSSNIAMASANASSGASLQRLETTFDGLQQRSLDDFAASLTVIGNLFDLILTDWGRLQALGLPLVGNQIVWDLTLDGVVLATLDRALRREYFLKLIPPVFEMGLWTGIAEGAAPQLDALCCKYAAYPCGIDCINCDVPGSTAENWLTLPTAPTGKTPTEGDDGQIYDIWLIGTDVRCSSNNNGGLLRPLFAPLDPNDSAKLGIYKPYFFVYPTLLPSPADPPFNPLRRNETCCWSVPTEPSCAPCSVAPPCVVNCCLSPSCPSWAPPCHRTTASQLSTCPDRASR